MPLPLKALSTEVILSPHAYKGKATFRANWRRDETDLAETNRTDFPLLRFNEGDTAENAEGREDQIDQSFDKPFHLLVSRRVSLRAERPTSGGFPLSLFELLLAFDTVPCIGHDFEALQ